MRLILETWRYYYAAGLSHNTKYILSGSSIFYNIFFQFIFNCQIVFYSYKVLHTSVFCTNSPDFF